MALFASFLLLAEGVQARITMPSFFSDGMVLQQKSAVAIWGSSDRKQQKVTVKTSWNAKKYTAVTDESGNWKVKVETPVYGGPYSMEVSDGESVHINNVLIGEVWLCSGQSNMDMRVSGRYGDPVIGSLDAIVTSGNPEVRMFMVGSKMTSEPLTDCEGIWQEASSETVPEFSAAGYFFARKLNQVLKVPVGIIHASYGGSRVEAWMSKEGIEPYKDLSDVHNASILYNGMLSPVVGYGIRGCLWYQGEANVDVPDLYTQLFPSLVNDWRKQWGIGEFPFYYAQIAPFNYNKGEGKGQNSAYLREAQAKCLVHLRVALDGEIVRSVDPHFGYIHRGVEKLCEGYTYPQILHLTDRLDYLSGTMNRHAFCLCCEKALQMDVPERAVVIRTIFDELTRIASHLLGWGSMCMDMGAVTAFMYGLRDREKIMDIFEETAGGRLMANYNVIGGVACDLHPNFRKRVKEFIPYMRKMLREHHMLYTGNPIATGRMAGSGYLSRERAIALGVTGPSGRASGWANDLRRAEPYAAYGKVEFEELLRTGGMTFDRYIIRLHEIEQSLRIIEQLIDNIPEGPYAEKVKGVIKLPQGDYFQRVENARGQFGVHITSRGDKTPYRVKFRSPSMVLVGALKDVAPGGKVADLIMLGGSFDYVIPCIDR